MSKRKKGGAMLLPKGVTREVMPSGNVRYRFRVTGLPQATLPGEPFTEEWQKALDAARQGLPLPAETESIDPAKNPYCLAALIMEYRASIEFNEERSESTKTYYKRYFKRMIEKNGHHDVRQLNAGTVRKLRNSLESPHVANRYVSILRVVMEYACESSDWPVEDNPCKGVSKRKVPKGGYHAWTDDEIAHFLAKYPSGTRERLSILLHLDTAQRPSDVCRMGPQHLSGNALRIRQQKTGAVLELFLAQETMAEIKRHPLGMAFIQTEYGRPFSTKGYQQWFSKRCSDIGLKHCSAHGLRKARSRMEAERSSTIKEIQSITGHKTSSEVDRYTKSVSQRKMAQQVAAKGLALPTPEVMDKYEEKNQ